jgi:ATP-dependent RNA helicase DeaD
MLGAIEKATRQKIEIMELPSTELINDRRIARFKQRITDTLANEDLELFTRLIEQYEQEHNIPAQEVAAALARLLQGDTPLLLQHKPQRKADKSRRQDERPTGKKQARKQQVRLPGKELPLEAGMQRYRLEVGHNHGVKPGNIVGAIANEAGIDSQYMGRINIYDDYSLIDLPEGMPKGIFNDLKRTRVAGQPLRISRWEKDSKPGKTASHAGPAGKGRSKRAARPGKTSKKPARRK